MTNGMTRSRVRYEKTCKQCNVAFTVPSHRKDTAIYCSRKCLALAVRVHITADCQECGTTFTHIASRANKAKYCSAPCYHKAMSKKGTVSYVCTHCQVTFLSSPSHKRKYCSRACVNKTRKDQWHPNFSTVRKAMLKRNMLLACERCGYNQHVEILGVHHKDRNRKNNDLSNLEVLCPNCHSLEHAKHISHGFTE